MRRKQFWRRLADQFKPTTWPPEETLRVARAVFRLDDGAEIDVPVRGNPRYSSNGASWVACEVRARAVVAQNCRHGFWNGDRFVAPAAIRSGRVR